MNSIHAAAFPRFYRKGSGGIHDTTAYALRILKRTGPLAIFLVVTMALAAPMIPYLVGKSFSDSVLALRLLCLLPLFRSFQYSAGDALTGAGRQKLRLGVQVAAAAFNFAIRMAGSSLVKPGHRRPSWDLELGGAADRSRTRAKAASPREANVNSTRHLLPPVARIPYRLMRRLALFPGAGWE
jgi:hypothetical protein